MNGKPPPTRFGRPPAQARSVQPKRSLAAPPPIRFAAQAKNVVPAIPPTRQARASGNIVQKAEASPSLTPVKYGGGQSETHHIVRSGWESNPGTNKIDKLYPEGSPGIRSARSYAGERPKQILRWLATTIFNQFPTAVEIQCYYDVASDSVWISSNKTSANTKMAESYGSDILTKLGSAHANTPREARHQRKLLSREKTDDQQPIMKALAKGRITIPIPKTDYDVDFHAERRIQHALGAALDPQYLGGVKRPCLVCARALNLVSAHPGPAWNSEATLYGYDLDGILSHAVANGIITHVTRDRVTKTLTTGYDTDSDSGEDS